MPSFQPWVWGDGRYWLVFGKRPQNHVCPSCGQRWQVGGSVYFKLPMSRRHNAG